MNDKVRFTSCRIIDGKVRWAIVDEKGGIISKNPDKEELKSLQISKLDSHKGVNIHKHTSRRIQWCEKYRVNDEDTLKKVNNIWKIIMQYDKKAIVLR